MNAVATYLESSSKNKAVYKQLVYMCFVIGKRIYCKWDMLTLSGIRILVPK
jgi:hypothetical protein